MYTIDRGLFSIFNWGASFDDMFMKFWIYMSFCMLNLIKGGDIAKIDFRRAQIQNGFQKMAAILDFA